VKVTDFAVPSETAHDRAPELARGNDPSALSDVYALRVVAYECLARHPPFEGDNQVAVALATSTNSHQLPNTIPRRIRALVDTAMEKDRSGASRTPGRSPPRSRTFAHSNLSDGCTSDR
jgi:eukaryotic-like serine/threonine-protein kinase